jgi:hypothetical protein
VKVYPVLEGYFIIVLLQKQYDRRRLRFYYLALYGIHVDHEPHGYYLVRVGSVVDLYSVLLVPQDIVLSLLVFVFVGGNDHVFDESRDAQVRIYVDRGRVLF